MRITCNGNPTLKINNQNMGVLGDSINDLCLPQSISGDVILKFIGNDVEVKWIGFYTEGDNSKGTVRRITFGDKPRLLFERTVGRDIAFLLEGVYGNIQWKIYDVVGRQVEQKNVRVAGRRRISAGRGLPSGVYFLRISGAIKTNKKVVIIR